MPYIGRTVDGFGVRNRFVYLASASDTSVSGADANGATLTFTDGAYVDVYLNGVLLKPGTDYNTTTANTIAGISAMAADDEVTVVVYDVFTVADTVSATSGGTFSGGVTVGSTLDVTGNVSLDGGNFVFNESSADKDFRIESNGKANMFFVDGGNDSVIIGHNAKISAVGSLDANLQLVSGDAQPSLDIVCFSDNANHRGQVTFSKSASDTIGTGAVVGTSDIVGDIVWGVHDGTDFANEIAFIRGQMDSAGVGANDTGGSIQFGTSSDGNNSATERMRIAENGDVYFGVTDLPSSSTGGAGFQEASNNRNVLYLATTSTGTSSVAVFVNGNGQVGTIKTSGSATQFNTSSDYRLKENVSYDWDATTRLKQLKPARFNFKADADTTVDGFLAHEVSSIVPQAISGAKDETQNVGTVKDKDGKVLYENVEEYKANKDKEQTWTKTGTEDVFQQIDQSKLVPLLVKTIQELEARVTELESK